MQDSRIGTLQRMPLFAGLRPDTLIHLMEHARIRYVRAGSLFFAEGEPALFMYVLEEGLVSVRRRWDGCELVLGRFDQGDSFGEMALLDPGARSASVRAEIDCVAIEISAGDLCSIQEYDAEQYRLLQAGIERELRRSLVFGRPGVASLSVSAADGPDLARSFGTQTRRPPIRDDEELLDSLLADC